MAVTLNKPHRLIPLLAGLQAFAPLSIDLYLPALPRIAENLATSQSNIQLTISSYLVGLFIGMLFFGPLSDKYGRKKLLIGGIVVYLLACVGCLLAQTAPGLIGWRLVQALGGASASVLGRAIVRDVFPLNESARALSLMHLITMIAALLAPLLGSAVLLIASWRWLFAGLLAYAAVLLLLTVSKIPETRAGDAGEVSVLDVFRAYLSIGSEPRALGYILCMSICFAGMFAYITVSPFVFIEYFSLSPQQYALIFSGNIAGVMLLATANARLVRTVGPQRMLYWGGGFCASAGLLLLIAGAVGTGSPWPIILGLFCYVSCTGLLGANCTASLMALYENNAGAAAGLAVATQFGLSAAVSTFASALYDGTPAALTLVVGVCGLCSLLALALTRERLAAVEN